MARGEFGKLTFDGKVYKIQNTFPLHKRDAMNAAKGWRQKGYNVRVIGRGRGGRNYYLFMKKKD